MVFQIERLHIFILTLVFSTLLQAQKTEIYKFENTGYKNAYDLYMKQQFSAAQNEFSKVIESIDSDQDEVKILSEYYHAICALELFHKDAEHLLNEFLFNHPDHPKGKLINFQLGNYYYRSKKYTKVIHYYSKTDIYDLNEEERNEYNFKLGYSYFYNDQPAESKTYFSEVLKSENEYFVPAAYYYGHVAYEEGNYQTALETFEKIKDEEMFMEVLPYYIAQIYYKQEKYKKLIEYAPPYYEGISKKRKAEFAKLIGDAYYYEKNYESAIPYLLQYRKSAKTSREDAYQLAYCYYRTKEFQSSIPYYQKAATKKDPLSQTSYYQMADAYLKEDQKDHSRNAFKAASELDFNENIQRNALYNYAKLSYELSFNPYDEAIAAFHEFIEKFPDDPKVEEAYEFLLKVYMTTKNYKAALASLENVNLSDDRMKMAFQNISYNLGVEEFHNKNYDEAIVNFRKAKKFTVDKALTASSYYWIAQSQYELESYPAAINSFVEFKLEPGAALTEEYYNADYGIGYSYFMSASPFESIDNFGSDAVKKQHNDLLNKANTAFRNFTILSDRVSKVKLQDAYLRIADCYYLLGKDGEAITYYDKVIKMDMGDLSYAYYQKAISQGVLGDQKGKAATLAALAKKYPNSNYKINSILDLASTYMTLQEFDKAIKTYKDFIDDYPGNGNIPLAHANIAVLSVKTKDYETAENYALMVLDKFPNAQDQNDKAIQVMKDVYESRGDVTGYYNWLASRGIQVSPSEKDSVLYEPLQEAFNAGNCTDVISHANTYLAEVTDPMFALNAHFYLAQCYYSIDKNKALTHYNWVIDRPNNPFYEEALQYGAFIAYENKDYPLALSHYNKLEQVATTDENIKSSLIAQLRCHKYLDNTEQIITYADKVLTLSPLQEVIEIEAMLAKGLAQKKLGLYKEAKTTLLTVVDKTQSIHGAEAEFHHAEILFLQEDHEACEKAVMELVQKKPSYDYWIARAIILLGKNYMAKEDYFNAKHSLQSVVDHYEGKDKAEIVTTAQNLIDEIIQIETSTQQKSVPGGEENIEFDGVDEKDKQLFNDDNK